jgi:hypothetical protein
MAGAISSILVSVFIIVALVSGLLAGPSPQDVAQALVRIDANKLLVTLGLGANIIIALFLIPVIPAVYLALREVHQTYTLLAAIIVGIGVVTSLLTSSTRYALVRLSDSYASASPADRTAIVAASNAMTGSSNVSSTETGILFGVATILISLVMLRGVFSKWVGWVGIVAGILALISLIPLLSILFFAGSIVYIIWFIGIGARLYRL